MKGLTKAKAEWSYQERICDENKKGRVKSAIKRNAYRVVGILLARAMPILGIAPFGISFLAMERRFSIEGIFSFLAVLIGYGTLGIKDSIGYMVSGIIFYSVLFFIGRKREAETKTVTIILCGIVAVVDILSMVIMGFSFGNVLKTLIDVGLLCLGIVVFDKCREIFKRGAISEYYPDKDEKLCLCIMSGLILLGLRDIYIIEGFSIANIFGLLAVGITSVSGGVLSGAVTGIIMGLLLGSGGNILPVLGIFSIIGITSGLCGRYGKYGVSAGMCLSGMLVSFYAMTTGVWGIRFYEVPVASAMLILLPERVCHTIGRFTSFGQTAYQKDSPVKLYVQTKLALSAGAFKSLAETFVNLSEKDGQGRLQDVGMLFDATTDRVCVDCPEVNRCWRKNYTSTYKAMMKFLEVLEKKRLLDYEDADPKFASQCIRLKLLIRELNKQFEIYKLNQIWKSKLSENRELVGEQFSGVAEILEKISTELDKNSTFDQMGAEEIKCRLGGKGISVRQVQVSRDFEGRNLVQLFMKNKAEQIDSTVIVSVLKSVLGVHFSCDDIQTSKKGKEVILQYSEAPRYKISAGYSCTGISKECGDSYILNLLKGGRYIAALSDGMGTGRQASRESNAIVELLEDFMSAGFDKAVAIKLINSAMVMKSVGEAFATVDMCIVDLFNCEAEFIKNGAEPSYIKRGDSTETIRSASLPVGVMSGVEIETFTHKLQAGDIVVMVSDGLEIRSGHDGWIKRAIEQTKAETSAEAMAEQIMEKAVLLKGGVTDDDMTVIVLKIEERVISDKALQQG